jgi:hypothetical protein
MRNNLPEKFFRQPGIVASCLSLQQNRQQKSSQRTAAFLLYHGFGFRGKE